MSVLAITIIVILVFAVMAWAGVLPQFLALVVVFFVAFYGIQWLVNGLIWLVMALSGG